MSSVTRAPHSRGRRRRRLPVVVALVGSCAFLITGCLGDDPMSSLPAALPSVTALPSLPARPSLPALRPEGEDTATAEPQETATPGALEPAGEGADASTPPAASAATSGDEGDRPADDTAEDGARAWWPGLVAAVVALLAVVALVLSRRRRRVRRAWDARLDSVASHIRWVGTSVVDGVLATPSTSQAAATWQSARPHLHSIGHDLDSLSSADTDEERRHGAQRLRDAFSDLVLAVDRETSPTPGDPVEALATRRADVVRAREVLGTVLEEVSPQ